MELLYVAIGAATLYIVYKLYKKMYPNDPIVPGKDDERTNP